MTTATVKKNYTFSYRCIIKMYYQDFITSSHNFWKCEEK